MYSVKMRIFWIFWRTFNGVRSDGLFEGCGVRWLELEDSTRVEFPVDREMQFSPARAELIRHNAQRAAEEAEAARMKGEAP